MSGLGGKIRRFTKKKEEEETENKRRGKDNVTCMTREEGEAGKVRKGPCQTKLDGCVHA